MMCDAQAIVGPLPAPFRSLASLLPLLLGAALFSAPAQGQETVSLQVPRGSAGGTVELATGTGNFAVPDLPPPAPLSTGLLDLRLSLVVLGDHTFFGQDSTSVGQVGALPDEWELRAARLSFLGSIGGSYRVGFQLSGEYKGFDGDPETDWQLTDMSLTFPMGERTKLQLGKTKQTFAYEMVGDAANLPAMERVLSPFFVSRNTGARLTHVWGPQKRGTFSAGLYNDAWDIGAKDRRGVDATARVTALLWADDDDDSHYFHAGAAVRNVASKGTLRYRGRPGSNVAPNFVDTGSFAADGALHLGLEGMLGLGPVSVQGEWVHAAVDSPTLGNPAFGGWYLTGSWVLTGDHRPYDRNVGYARRVVPKGRWGAPELVVRYSDVDLQDDQVDGGRFRRTDLGLNWWATRRWKAGIAWGHVWLDRAGVTGETDTLLTRIQWVY
jgi:phosphate-selective porin OprO/OprP